MSYTFIDVVYTHVLPRDVLCLLRRRLSLSREVSDDVVRAQGFLRKHFIGSTLIEEVSYFNKNRHGLEHGWHANGALWWESSYDNGKRNNSCRTWFPNGKLSSETFFIYGKRLHGITKYYREDGSFMKEVRHSVTFSL